MTKDLDVRALFVEELLLVVPPDHSLASTKEITVEAIEKYPFIMLNEAHCLSDNIESYCRQQSVQPVSIERISQIATVQELVALGHGISIVPEMARRLDDSDRRTYRSFTNEKPIRTVALALNPQRYQSKWVQLLVDYLQAQAGS
jgi:LysR family hydrogen peroxide-inducible transcriptional activator